MLHASDCCFKNPLPGTVLSGSPTITNEGPAVSFLSSFLFFLAIHTALRSWNCNSRCQASFQTEHACGLAKGKLLPDVLQAPRPPASPVCDAPSSPSWPRALPLPCATASKPNQRSVRAVPTRRRGARCGCAVHIWHEIGNRTSVVGACDTEPGHSFFFLVVEGHAQLLVVVNPHPVRSAQRFSWPATARAEAQQQMLG